MVVAGVVCVAVGGGGAGGGSRGHYFAFKDQDCVGLAFDVGLVYL